MRYRINKGQAKRALGHDIDTHFQRYRWQEEIKGKWLAWKEGKEREPQADTENC